MSKERKKSKGREGAEIWVLFKEIRDGVEGIKGEKRKMKRGEEKGKKRESRGGERREEGKGQCKI